MADGGRRETRGEGAGETRSVGSGSFVEAVVLVALAGWILWDARSYPAALVEGAPGPAFFPRLLAILLILAAISLVSRARARAARRPGEAGARKGGGDAEPAEGGRGGAAGAAPEERVEGEAHERPQWIPVGVGLLVVSFFLLVTPWLGTVLALVPLVGALMWLTGERSKLALATVPLGFATFIYVVFTLLLRVPLPSGLL